MEKCLDDMMCVCVDYGFVGARGEKGERKTFKTHIYGGGGNTHIIVRCVCVGALGVDVMCVCVRVCVCVCV